MKMIDPLGIFQRIKTAIDEVCPGKQIFAFGSRCRGISHSNKWDFDICVSEITIQQSVLINEHLKKLFEGQKDENGNQIKVDVFRTNAQSQYEFRKNISYGKKLL